MKRALALLALAALTGCSSSRGPFGSDSSTATVPATTTPDVNMVTTAALRAMVEGGLQ